jgi:predicted TIM-barrel fold metal-dependent hydrolase
MDSCNRETCIAIDHHANDKFYVVRSRIKQHNFSEWKEQMQNLKKKEAIIAKLAAMERDWTTYFPAPTEV